MDKTERHIMLVAEFVTPLYGKTHSVFGNAKAAKLRELKF
jgi:hypothetical protein